MITKSTFHASLLALSLERGGPEPMHVSLARELRARILDGRIAPGSRLPSSRALAEELSVSRVTVVSAIDQLVAEGYAEGRRGSGVYVASDLPEEVLQAASGGQARALGDEGLAAPRPARPFQPAQPDMALFPHAEWARLFQRVWREPAPELLAAADPLGLAELRCEIARHLALWRGIDCRPGEVVVTSGAAEALELIAHGLVGRGRKVAVEEPGYPLAARVLERLGLGVVPVPVDDQGLEVSALARLAPDAAAVLLTPSRHYPLGATLPLARRLDLLAWAREGQPQRLVIEDDYDSEYRYRGRPLPALMGLDAAGPVIYVGSFSKVLTSGLRLGFVVAREPHLGRIARAMAETGARAGLTVQPMLARFMASGDFARHIRRMRRLYARRQKALVEAVSAHLAGLLSVEPAPAGMHLVASLTPALARRMDDGEASRRAASAEIVAPALSSFYAGERRRQGLLLGYAGFDEVTLDAAARTLAEALG